MTGTPFCWDALGHLHHAVRTGEAGISRLHPGGWIGYLDVHPGQRAIFQAAMTAKAHDDIAAVLDAHDFSGYRRICDVGGGHGHLLKAVLDRYAETSGVLFELPAVAAEIPSTRRFDVVAGDFFTDPLPDADLYVLMNVVHDWDDNSAVAILSAVGQARRGAAVLLLEAVMPEGPQRHWSKTLDVLMLAVTGGRERTLTEYRDLLSAAGIDLAGTTPTATPFSIMHGHTRHIPADSAASAGISSAPHTQEAALRPASSRHFHGSGIRPSHRTGRLRCTDDGIRPGGHERPR